MRHCGETYRLRLAISMDVTIIYDNTVYERGLKADWGFACLVEPGDGRRILFDTGTKGDILLHNMERLAIDPMSIDEVFISHAHFDHTGGLSVLLRSNDKVKLYLPLSMSNASISGDTTCIREATEIHDGVYSTGELGGMEQSLACRTEKGLAVIVGCSHPGVEAILEVASRWGQPHAIIGGLHGFRQFELMKDLELVCACHCTQYQSDIRAFCGEKYDGGGAGKRFLSL